MSGGRPALPGPWGKGMAALILLMAGGCAARRPLPSLPPAPSKVTIGPGDLVEVRFIYTPDMNLTQNVRPDGKITLDLIGDVDVSGLTPAEAAAKLRRLYADELKTPVITVILRSQYARRVFVGGEVVGPGVFPMPGRMTLTEAIMMAQGVKPETAEISNVLVIRQINGRRHVESFDLRPVLGRRRPDPDRPVPELVLRPGDIVYVPETRIVRIARWVDQHINQIIPDTNLLVTGTVGTTTLGFVND